jgi:hypothetical protein
MFEKSGEALLAKTGAASFTLNQPLGKLAANHPPSNEEAKIVASARGGLVR